MSVKRDDGYSDTKVGKIFVSECDIESECESNRNEKTIN